MILYLYGVTNVVIKATMLEDFFYPAFNGLNQVGYIKNKTTFLGSFYVYFIVYSYFVFPFLVSYFIKILNLWLITSVLLALIYLVNYLLYRKSYKLKKAESISYGGIIYVKN